MDREQAIKATRNGAIAGCVSGFFGLILVTVAVFWDSSGRLALWSDPVNYFDVFLIFVFAFGVFKKSRIAAVMLLVYFVFSRVVIGLETGALTGIGLALVFVFFYVKAIKGAFVFHKIERAENPDYKTASRWFYFTVIPLSLVFVALLGIGLASTVGVMPSTEVQAKNEIPQKDYDLLVSNDIIYHDDNVQYFYSNGFTSILEGGSILTDDRVILYLPDEEELGIYELYFEDIASVELLEKGGTFSDSVYKISGHDPEAWLQIALSAENGGDVKFVDALRSYIKNTHL